MADYSIVTQYPTIEFLGGTQTRDVIAVGVRTAGHGVYFEFRLPKKAYKPANVKNEANGFTIVYEDLFKIPGVVDVEWSQQPTAAGQLEDHVTVYYESTSGDSSNFADVPYSQFTQAHIAALVKAGREALDEAEAS